MGYCVAGNEYQCIGNGSDWLIEVAEYSDFYCEGNVTNSLTFECKDTYHDNGWCQCGQDICEQDKIMTIQSGDIADDGECFEESEIAVLKDECIWGGWLGDDTLHRVILRCDEERQEISYHSWDNDDCSGKPKQSNPVILINFDSVNFCANLFCDEVFDVPTIAESAENTDPDFAELSTTNESDQN